eukprot:SAG31_NODE_2877_length_4965_cov_15.095767_3_plen_372_part_00
MGKDTTVVFFEEGKDRLGADFIRLGAPDVVDLPVGYRSLPLIDTLHPRGSAHEGELSDHPFLQAGVSVITKLLLNVKDPRGRPIVKCQVVKDFETFRDLLDKRTAQLRVGGGDLFKGLVVRSYIFKPSGYFLEAGVFVVTRGRPNVLGPRDLPTDSQEVQDLLAHITGRSVRVSILDETGNASRGKNDPADDPANIDPTGSGTPLAICDQVEPVLTKPMAAVSMWQPQVVNDVVDVPVDGCRSPPLNDAMHSLGTTYEGQLSDHLFSGAGVSVGNASRGKNDPADDPANIDPTESGAPVAICDQVEPFLAKPMTAIIACLAANLATMFAMPAPHLKVATQFVGALVVTILISTFALGIFAAVRNLLVELCH